MFLHFPGFIPGYFDGVDMKIDLCWLFLTLLGDEKSYVSYVLSDLCL